MTETTMQPVEAEMISSHLSLLTLSGIYQTSKSVYATYMPEAATKTVESLADRLLAASSPYVTQVQQKVLNGKVDSLKEQTPLDVHQVDALVSSLCTSTDARVEQLLAASTSKVHDKVNSVNSTVHDRVSAVKSMVHDRVESIKPAVQVQVDHVKAVVHQGMENERIAQLKVRATDIYSNLTSKTTTYYTSVKDYTPVARHLVMHAVDQLQTQVREQGAVASAKLGASFLTTKAMEAINAMRSQGPLSGAKSVVGSWSSEFVHMLSEAKEELDHSSIAEEQVDVSTPVLAAENIIPEHVIPEVEEEEVEEEEASSEEVAPVDDLE